MAFFRLCHLIEKSLLPFAEVEVISLSKEKEKGLMIVLSQVSREIHLWTRELACDSDNENESEPASNDKFLHGSGSNHEEHNCLTKILADLVLLLKVENQYVQHLVGNILVVISEFVAASGCEFWEPFVSSLCLCLEFAITNLLSHSMASSENEAQDSNFHQSVNLVLKPRLKSASWSTMAGIVQVLRNILKHVKQENDDEFLEVYLDSISSFLSNVPWDFMDDIYAGQSNCIRESNAETSHFRDASFLRNGGEVETKFVFLGNLLQLLCSLVEQKCCLDAQAGSQDQHPVLGIIISLVPKLSHWCIAKQGNCVRWPISEYFRHKLLMLMLRLHFQTSLGCSTLVTWLQLLHDYFEDLLLEPMTKHEFCLDECLEGSPFLLVLSGAEVRGQHSCHLQRQAVLLFLRCCFSLITWNGEANKQCACATLNSCWTFDLDSVMDCCSRKKGSMELYKWLQGHIPTDVLVDHQMYLQKCICFALSFLQLYMHEDDLLFKVLLQLLTVPAHSGQQLHGEESAFQDKKGDIPFHVSDIFSPIYLFHLFLAELHYDHQVLLDYLISKDTGVDCALYLLRCLRTVCDSWTLFVKFSNDTKFIDQRSRKKIKLLLDGANFLAEPSSIPTKATHLQLEEECKRDFRCGYKISESRSQSFEKAKDCLLSLKCSVENLHQKNLFPYNPEVLLKR